MSCGCNKKSDDTEAPQKSSINWTYLIILLIALALGWYFFMRAKGPDAFFEAK
jgi:hypothetical protein